MKNGITSGSSVQEEKPIHHSTKTSDELKKTSARRISPAAKLLISEHALDSSLINASGPHGTLLKGDVLAAIKVGTGTSKVSSSKEKAPPTPQIYTQTSTAPAESRSPLKQSADSFEDISNTQIRKVGLTNLIISSINVILVYKCIYISLLYSSKCLLVFR